MRSRRRKNSRLGMRQPSANNSGGMNSSRNSFGSRSTCKPKLGTLIAAPGAIWVNGNGNSATRTNTAEQANQSNRARNRIAAIIGRKQEGTQKSDTPMKIGREAGQDRRGEAGG